MRRFELYNVVKVTDNNAQIRKLLAKGFKEVETEKDLDVEENQEPEKEDLNELTVAQLKERADAAGLEYDSKILKPELIELVGQ